MNHENMKMTEVGWIPKDWEVKTLEELFNSYSTASFSRDQMNADNDVFCVHYGDIHTKYGHVVELGKDVTPMISTEQAGRFMRLNDGDIILADASEDYEGVGKAIVVLTEGKTAISGLHTILLRKKVENDFSTTFPSYMFAGRIVKHQIEHLSEGTKINSISFKKIKDVLAIYPKATSEQRRIASVLSDTDSLIASLSRTIEKKRLVKQGAMQQLLTGKTRLKGFSGEWVEKELGECADIYRGGSPRPIEAFITTSPDGLNWIKIGDVANNAKYINKTAEKIIQEGERHSRFVKNGDLLLSNSMSFGRPYILKTDGCIHDGWLVIQNYKDEWYTDFLYYLLCSEDVLEQYEVLAAGSGVKNLNKAIVSNVMLRYPVDLNEQFAIANILTTMDNEIASLEAELQKYKSLKQGMMQKLLTGQIRLTNSTK